MSLRYKNRTCNKFVADMAKAGIAVEHYNGRWYWQGPAARTDEQNGPTLQEVMSATKVKLQKDNLAFDWIVYPVVSGELLDTEIETTHGQPRQRKYNK